MIRVTYFNSFEEKTYIINYLDDIFYRRSETKNKFYVWSLIIRFSSLFSIFYYVTLLNGIGSESSAEGRMLVAMIFLLMILFFCALNAIIDLPRKFKTEIYDNEIAGYNSSKLFLAVHFAIFSNAILLCIIGFKEYLVFLIVSTILLVLNGFDFIKVSFEYTKYVLMYQENDKDPRALFPKVN